MLRKLFSTPPASPALTRVHPTREKTHHLVPYLHSPTPPIRGASLPLPALNSQSEEDEDKEWVLVLTPQQKMMQSLQDEQKKLIHQLQQTPGYIEAFNYQLTLLATLTEDETNLEKATRYTERVNILLKKMLSLPHYYQACMQYAQQTTPVEPPSKIYLAYAKALQEFIFLEVLFFETYQPSQPRYQTLLSLGRRIVFWRALNAEIDRYIANQHTPAESKSLVKTSIWYHAQQTQQKLLCLIETPAHLIDMPQIYLSQIFNAALTPLQEFSLFSQRLYSLPCWKHYLLKGYQYDPTIKGKILEKTCRDIKKLLEEAVGKERIGDTWPFLDEDVEQDLYHKFTQGLISILPEEFPLCYE
jgi:hypothetical protein